MGLLQPAIELAAVGIEQLEAVRAAIRIHLDIVGDVAPGFAETIDTIVDDFLEFRLRRCV